MAMQGSNQLNHDQTPEPASNLGVTLLRVAWLAIALGLLMEGILLVLGGTLGEALGLKPLVADLVKNITWSVFVCVGLAIGTAVVKARVPVMGVLGLLSGARSSGAPDRPPIRGNRDSSHTGTDRAAVHRERLDRVRQRGPLSRRLLPGSLLRQGPGREGKEPARPGVRFSKLPFGQLVSTPASRASQLGRERFVAPGRLTESLYPETISRGAAGYEPNGRES